MQYLFDIHCSIVCLKMDFVYRMKHVREGERRSRRKLGLSSELKTYPFEPGVPRFWYKLVVEVPVPVPVEATTPELPWDLQNIAVVTSVARPVVSSPTPAIHLGYGETMASIGFSLNIFYLPIKQTKWIRHKLNKLMKSSPNYNMLQ